MGRRRRGRGEGSIYQRADGRWVGCLSLGNGKRKYFYGATRRDVAEQLTAALRAQQQGMLVAGPRQPVERYLLHWVEAVAPRLRPKTLAAYTLNIRRAIPTIGALTLERLTPVDVQHLYRVLLDRGLSRRSVAQCHAVLHKALADAVRWGMLARNPAALATPPRPERRVPTTLTRAQVRALVAATRGTRWHALWVVLCTTGLRVGEATALRWTDVDMATGRLTVARSLTYLRVPVFAEPKTPRSRRTVYVAPVAVQALTEHRALQDAERVAAGALWQEHDLVFCRPDGTPLAPWQVRHALHQTLARLGLPPLRVHDLRHTAATLLLADGAHPKAVQELLGHATITLTLDTYSHVTPAIHHDVAARMNRLVGADDATP